METGTAEKVAVKILQKGQSQLEIEGLLARQKELIALIESNLARNRTSKLTIRANELVSNSLSIHYFCERVALTKGRG